MKKTLILFISLITVATFSQTEEPFSYQKEWATANPLHSTVSFFSDGSSLLYGYNLDGAFDELVPENSDFKQHVLAKISNEPELAFTLPFGDNSTILHNSLISIDEENNFYLSGHTQQADEIGTTGTHQPDFQTNMTLPDTLYLNETDYVIYPPRLCNKGYLVKYDTNGNKLWGTYLGGNQEETLHQTIAKNGEIMVVGRTFSNTGLATPGAYMEEPDEYLDDDNQAPFIAKFDSATGNLLWATYLPSEFGNVQDVTLHPSGEIFISKHWYSSIDGYAPKIVKIATDGTTITETPLTGMLSTTIGNPFRMKIDSENNLYITGHTSSSENITTPGTYKTIKTNNREGYILKYDSALNKLWGTYLPVEWVDVFDSFAYPGGFPHTDDNGNTNLYIIGATSESGLATQGAYQETITGETDLYLLKLNDNGQLNWFSYFGGPAVESTAYSQTFVDENDNLYFSGISKSTSDILTENPLFDYPQFPIPYKFIAKFAHVKNVSHPQQEYSFRLYPNPATDYLAIESTFLFDNNTMLTVFDLQGKKVHQQTATYANTQVIKTNTWAKGNYLLEISNSQFTKTIKFVVR